MSNTVVHEHPGVYSAYDASGVIGSRASVGVIGVAAVGMTESVNEVVTLSSVEEAIAAFGEDFTGCIGMEAMVRALCKNGAGTVKAVGVYVDDDGEFDYESAFAVLEKEEDIFVLVCDSTDVEVHQAMRASIDAAASEGRERIGVVTAGEGETVAQLTERAGKLNSERMVYVALAEADAAAAVAAVIAAESDPSMPLNGAELAGVTLTAHYDNDQLDQLIRGGVTPLEELGGRVSIVRGITTRTKTNGAADATWRELTSIRIVDDVISSLRNELRVRFARRKNTEQVRAAIRSQVILALESKRVKEIIESFGEVQVSASADDPTVCEVGFSFAVAHGLNRIYLSAHITV